MRSRRLFPSMLGLLAVLAGLPATSAEKSSILQDEPGLAKRVSVSSYHIYLGELFDRLSRESGVRLEVDERHSPLSGYELAMVVRDKPAWQVLEGIRRLYSFPPDRWYWTKEKAPDGGPRYMLHNTLSPAQLQQLREARALELLLAERRSLSAFYRQPQARRDQLAAADPSLKRANTSDAERAFSFVADLPDDAFRSILAGTPRKLPAAGLSAPQRAYLGAMFDRLNAAMRQSKLAQEGAIQPKEHTLDEVEEVIVSRTDAQMGGLPTIQVRAGAGGGQVLGGYRFMDFLRERPIGAWVQPDETRQAPEGTVPADGQKRDPEVTATRSAESPDRVLERFGHLANQDLIYDRPAGRSWTFYRIFNVELRGPLPDVLQQLHGQNLIWKRWEQTFLFRLADWESIPREALVPWSTIRQLRSQVDAEGNPTLDRYLLLAALTPEQRTQLSRDSPFPAVPGQDTLLRTLQFAGGTTAGERRAMERPEGAGWTDWSPTTRQRAAQFFEDSHLRLHLKAEVQRGRPVIEYAMGHEGERLRIQWAHLYRPQPDAGTQYPESVGR